MTRSVAKTSGDLLKTTKLNMSLSSEETNLKNLQLEIGKKVHEIYQYGGSLGKFFDEKYLEIEACERKIAEIKEEISLIKGTRNCPKCGKPFERTAEFCQKCGIRVELTGAVNTNSAEPAEFIEPAEPVSPPDLPPTSPRAQTKMFRKCRVCGSENDNDTKFCLSCGRIVD